MSEENVAIARKLYDVFNRHDFDGFKALAAEDVEIDASERVFDPGVHRGYEKIREFLAHLDEVWDSQQFDPHEFLETDGQVVVLLRITATGKGSGVETAANAAHVLTIRNREVVRIQVFQTRAEALEAAGLAE